MSMSSEVENSSNRPHNRSSPAPQASSQASLLPAALVFAAAIAEPRLVAGAAAWMVVSSLQSTQTDEPEPKANISTANPKFHVSSC